jgi:hypothetical protein
MWRVCGASSVRSRSQQRVCWCRGIFCGPGGAHESERFWRDLKTRKVANTGDQFRELCQQADLFADTAIVDAWRERVFERWEPKPEPRPRKSKTVEQPGGAELAPRMRILG